MYRGVLLQVFLLTICAAENQTLIVTKGDAVISINETDVDPVELPYEFYAPEDLLRIGVQLFTVDSNETVENLCGILKEADPTVVTCEADAAYSIDQGDAIDDPLVTQQPSLDIIRATDAWAKGYTGDPAVRVCVIDAVKLTLSSSC